MPSGAKRRKATRKKKEKTQTAISNGNGEVKVVESDGGENSSPASQEFEPRQNPFSKDEAKEPSGGDESTESEKDPSFSFSNGYGKVVVIAGEANSDNGGRSFDFRPQKESAEVKIDVEKDGRMELQKNEDEEKVHPSETFSDLEEATAESLLSPDAILEQRPEDIIGRQLQQSDVRVSHSEQRAGSSVIHQVAEKEPLLRTAPRPENKTSWTGCCGLLDLFTGSGR
uniref:Uncharacterized protein n=1 Tax=Kalanchoe fedtschenkoi TaxID=63787 RepID=A0A7N0T3W0_KALFE